DVWPETAVSETVLTVAIRELRRVLGDQARHPQFIATVHGRGYRFIAPVTGEESAPARAPAAGTLPRLQAPAHGRAAGLVGQVRAIEALWVGHGQCVEAYGAGEPYLPLLEAVGRLCQGPEGTRRVAMLRQYAPN